MNMSKSAFEKNTAGILAALANPFRVRIALALGEQEACVCHLEQLLQKRQAYISQHLMVLREVGLLETRRDGKYVYYRLASPAVLALVRAAAELAGVDRTDFPAYQPPDFLEKCECPNCGLDDSAHSEQIYPAEPIKTSKTIGENNA